MLEAYLRLLTREQNKRKYYVSKKSWPWVYIMLDADK